MDDFLRQYDCRAIEVRPKPTSKEQVTLGIKLSSALNRYRTLRLRYEYKDRELSLKVQDAAATGEEGGTLDADYDLLKELWQEKSSCALELLKCIDLVKGQGMVYDSASTVDELKKYKGQAIELREQLHDAQHRIMNLEALVRLLGGNPDNAGQSFTGDVEER